MGPFNYPTSLLRLYSPSLHAVSLTQDIYTACTWHHPVPCYALDTHYEYFYLYIIFFSCLLDSSDICFDSSYTFTPIWYLVSHNCVDSYVNLFDGYPEEKK